MAEDTTTAASIDLFTPTPPESPERPASLLPAPTATTSPLTAESPAFVPQTSPVSSRGARGRGRGRGARGSSNPFGLSPETRGPKKVVPAAENAEDGEKEVKEEPRRRREPYVREVEPQREKLSEEALSEKLASMKLRNAQLTAQREAALADETEYSTLTASERAAQKEAQKALAAKQAERKQLQEQIDAERKANAARKLAKLQGREWDSQKEDSDFDPSRGSSFGGGGSFVDEETERRYSYSHRERGRGQTTRGRGRGRIEPKKPLDVQDESAFPALPGEKQEVAAES